MIKLPPVDQTKLHEADRCRNRAYALRKEAEELERRSRSLRRQHYNEQYDRCRACNGNGVWGEGLLSQTCPYCNCGLLPKGTLDVLRASR